MRTWNAIFALTVRDWNLRLGRSPMEIFWIMWEPGMHMLFYMAATSLMPRRPHEGDSFALFFASGILPFFLFQRTFFRISIGLNQQTLYPLRKIIIFDVVVSRIIIEISVWLMNVFFILVVLLAINTEIYVYSAIPILKAIVGLICLGVSWGMLVGFVSSFVPFMPKLANFINRVMYFTCGIFFVPDHLPPFIRAFVEWNPLMHLVEMFRSGLYYGYGSLIMDQTYPFIVSLILITCATLLENIAIKQYQSA